MRNSSSATSATRLSTCSVCARPCTASPWGSGAAWPASPPWPDAAPAPGERPRDEKLKKKKNDPPRLIKARVNCRNYNEDTDEEEDEEGSEEEDSEEEEDEEEENEYKALGHSCEYPHRSLAPATP